MYVLDGLLGADLQGVHLGGQPAGPLLGGAEVGIGADRGVRRQRGPGQHDSGGREQGGHRVGRPPARRHAAHRPPAHRTGAAVAVALAWTHSSSRPMCLRKKVLAVRVVVTVAVASGPIVNVLVSTTEGEAWSASASTAAS